jgi:hypothetical protein
MKKQTVEEKVGRLAAHLKAGLEMQETLMDLLSAISEYEENHHALECKNIEAAIHRAWSKWEEFEDCHQEDMELAACQMRAEVILERQREREEYWRKQREEREAKAAKPKKAKVKLAKAA